MILMRRLLTGSRRGALVEREGAIMGYLYSVGYSFIISIFVTAFLVSVFVDEGA